VWAKTAASQFLNQGAFRTISAPPGRSDAILGLIRLISSPWYGLIGWLSLVSCTVFYPRLPKAPRCVRPSTVAAASESKKKTRTKNELWAGTGIHPGTRDAF
jgi:hypothetical protein